MIQRIQTIYLLLSVILLGLSYAFNLLLGFSDTHPKLYLQFSMLGLSGDLPYSPPLLHWAMPALIGIALLLQICSIFSFKKLKKQARIILFSNLFILAFYGVLGHEYIQMKSQLGGAILPDLGAVFPLVSIVFSNMAWRAIQRDNKLIRSIDRIR